VEAMKQLKRPTKRQKDFIEKHHLNCDNWLVERDTPEELVLVHRHTGKPRAIRKGA
jgi:hypothetical protein